MRFRSIALPFLCAWVVLAQQGDEPGEVQTSRVPSEQIPPAPVLSPEQALKTFTLQDGFDIEIVAAEPLIEAPVAAEFGPDGRLWVLEMRGFMPNADGIGEEEPVGRLSVLDDTNGDGRMDATTVFIDGLVMPRAFKLVRHGVLLAEPPNLWFCRDTNGDGKADERNLVANDYAVEADPKLGRNANPEHSANGLLWALDNWIYSANYTTRFRNVAGLWQREPTIFRGQWGITQDDFGRLFYNSNSDHLRGDLVPAHYLRRNPEYEAAGANVRIANDQSVWPGRVNPGVNRGYQAGQLRPDGTLASFTGACGPVIYRGDQFPAEFRGNAFVCEPTGNLIRRSRLVENDAVISAENAYQRAEFLTSIDERFRPVNLHNGPDGALYVVDMYHGIIQHRMYLTSYLRNQALDRGLDKPVNVGRIYRVIHRNSSVQRQQPRLDRATSTQLAGFLAHPNGWWRDTAQRLLVERADFSVVPHLRQIATNDGNPLAQLHALWTLDGMAQTGFDVLLTAMQAKHPKVRAAAVRLCEPFLTTSRGARLLSRILELAEDPAVEVQLQVALTLGEIPGTAPLDGLAAILERNRDHRFIRDAVLSGLGGRQLASHPTLAAAMDQVVKSKESSLERASNGAAADRDVVTLTPEQQARLQAGKELYVATCGACHQPHGKGQEGLAPGLVDSEWVLGPVSRLVLITLHGVRGPITVNGKTYEMEMPPLSILDDEQIASVLTYVRREWGHSASPVDPETVAKIRAETADRLEAWTEPELLKIP